MNLLIFWKFLKQKQEQSFRIDNFLGSQINRSLKLRFQKDLETIMLEFI